MKNELVSERLGDSAKPDIVRIIAVALGFWVSQSLAWYFFSGSLMKAETSLAGALSVGVFTLFFILHLCRPWSKAAAILGLCSVGVFAGCVEYISSPVFKPGVQLVEIVVLVSVALALAGLLLDVEKCRQLAGKADGHPRLKVAGHSLHESHALSTQRAFKLL